MASGQKAADPEVVDLYRLLYNADHPLSFTELVDGMPSAYQNDANRGYAKHRDEEGDDPIPDPWSRRQLRTALEWWVGMLLDRGRRDKRFIATSPDGSRAWGKRRDALVYEANRNNPPTVMEEVLVFVPTKWTPDIGAIGRRHMKGVQFREEWIRIQRLGKHDRDKTLVASKKDLEAALELAAEALSYQPPRRSDGDR